MEHPPKCILLPIDGTEEALKPVNFLQSLYPNPENVELILSYFLAPLPPIYRQAPRSKTMAEKKKELLQSRKEDAEEAFAQARRVLAEAGFSEDFIHDHVQEKWMSVAQHACHLADIKKVDAVLIQKRVSSTLEGYLKDDPTHALLHHCIVSPVWFTEGSVNPLRCAVCVLNEEPSVRAADHAAFMLAETAAHITLLHVSRSAWETVSSPAYHFNADLQGWIETPAGIEIGPFLTESCQAMKDAGIGEHRVQVTVLPSKGRVASEILSFCRQQDIGIVVLGHSSPEGTWSFLKGSVTKKILAELRNMAVWVHQ